MQLMDLVQAYLKRRVMPKHFDGEGDAQIAEVSALVRVAETYAPSSDVETWWARVTDRMDTQAATRAWPTVFELKRAVADVAKDDRVIGGPVGAAEATIDPLMANAARMKAGDPVCESYVWGTPSDRLVQSGLLSAEQRALYRRGAAAMAQKTYGAAARDLLHSRHGDVVLAYFSEKASA